MKIKDICPNFCLDDDLNSRDVVKIYNSVIKSGKTKANIVDFQACADCGDPQPRLIERVRGFAKGTILHCDNCGWEIVGDEWEYLSEQARANLEKRHGSIKRESGNH